MLNKFDIAFQKETTQTLMHNRLCNSSYLESYVKKVRVDLREFFLGTNIAGCFNIYSRSSQDKSSQLLFKLTQND